MWRNRIGSFPVILFFALGVATGLVGGDAPRYSTLPKYQTPVPYVTIRNWHVTQNLGPTGLRGAIYGHDSSTHDSREILIKSVEPGSPAEGLFQVYDIVVGAMTEAGGEPKPFASDARLAFARAVTLAESEAGRGNLGLLRWRDGATSAVTVPLEVLGDYSETAPFDCLKTQRIVDRAAQQVAQNMPVNGFDGMTGALNALFLMATGEERYLDHIRRSAYRMGVEKKISDAGHETWRWGYCNLFLCEYYLATGDKRVLPNIQEYCERLAKGQCNPGTWGHSTVANWIPPGYGSMNQSGLVCFMSLVLGRECGVSFDQKSIRNCINFYGRYAGKGGIPYGDHSPARDATGNGKNGSAAVAFQLLKAEPAAQWFARLCASTNLAAFEGGHTGNFFNQTWTPLGAALSGRANYQAFWKRFHRYRDLARRADGTFVSQPLPHIREGDLGTGNYVRKGPLWSTGGFGLSYLATNRSLRILGREESVFAKRVPAALQPALALYEKKQFAACHKAATALAGSAAAEVKALAEQLQTCVERNRESLALTLKAMAQNLAAGDLCALHHQLVAIEALVDKQDPRLEAFRKALVAPTATEVIAMGQLYHEQTTGFAWVGLKGFEWFAPRPQPERRTWDRLKTVATRGKGLYQKKTRAWLDQQAAQAKTATVEWVAPLKINGNKIDSAFDCKDPNAVTGLILWIEMDKGMQVALNGTVIADYVVGPGWRTNRSAVAIPLKTSTLELLKKGENTLTFCNKTGKAGCRLEALVRK